MQALDHKGPECSTPNTFHSPLGCTPTSAQALEKDLSALEKGLWGSASAAAPASASAAVPMAHRQVTPDKSLGPVDGMNTAPSAQRRKKLSAAAAPTRIAATDLMGQLGLQRSFSPGHVHKRPADLATGIGEAAALPARSGTACMDMDPRMDFRAAAVPPMQMQSPMQMPAVVGIDPRLSEQRARAAALLEGHPQRDAISKLEMVICWQASLQALLSRGDLAENNYRLLDPVAKCAAMPEHMRPVTLCTQPVTLCIAKCAAFERMRPYSPCPRGPTHAYPWPPAPTPWPCSCPRPRLRSRPCPYSTPTLYPCS